MDDLFVQGLEVALEEQDELRRRAPYQLRAGADALLEAWSDVPIIAGYARGLLVIAGELEDQEAYRRDLIAAAAEAVDHFGEDALERYASGNGVALDG
jgi:hypothetical protein